MKLSTLFFSMVAFSASAAAADDRVRCIFVLSDQIVFDARLE